VANTTTPSDTNNNNIEEALLRKNEPEDDANAAQQQQKAEEVKDGAEEAKAAENGGNSADDVNVAGEEQKKEEKEKKEEAKDNSADDPSHVFPPPPHVNEGSSSSTDANVAAGQLQKEVDEEVAAEVEEEPTIMTTTEKDAATTTTTTDANIAVEQQQQHNKALMNDEKKKEGEAEHSSSSSDFLSSLFSSSTGRSGQKVETSSDPKAAVLEYLLGTTAAAEVEVPQKRILTVEYKVTSSILINGGDSGGPGSKKLINGQVVSVSGDTRVYIVWTSTDEGSSTSSGGIQLYVEPLDGGRRAFFALVSANVVSIPGTNNKSSTNTTTQSASSSSATTSPPAEVVDLSFLPASTTIIPPSADADSGLSTSSSSSSSSSSSAESSNSSSAGGGGANNKTSSTNCGNNGVVLHDLTEKEHQQGDSPADDDSKKKNAPSLSKEEASTFMASGVIPQRFITSANEEESESEILQLLLAEGLVSLALVQELFSTKGGVQSLGVSLQGGGDIALTDSSVKSVIAPFVMDFILRETLKGCFGDSSNIASSSSSIDDLLSTTKTLPIPPSKPSTDEEVSRMLWIGAGGGQEVHELLLELNPFRLTNYLHIDMTDIDYHAVNRFNASRVSLPNVTYTLVNDNSLASHMVPGGRADIVYTAMMNGPFDFLCVLVSAVNHVARWIVSFERNLAYLAPVMKSGAVVLKRLGTVKTTGGTSFQLCALEIYAEDQKVR